ncbi:hypothetical protein HG535_0C06220 [Zygotorulaspora mrakii]|uniref:C2H2-type domain-containing protein n=1 Tax=Zygotorulaspora mrakii TaxID=42260 RepID=A0A7H9B199_ZYGMR|nr:uncharacterized protein HG535_0C06220 [Zygotorulaspora mrakii]QLG72267.1 hypothetical protein HG535_0C06220 [Zygotorulaspora mrakii]
MDHAAWDAHDFESVTPTRSCSSDSLHSVSSVASSAVSSASSSRPKRYFCDYEGCNKCFTRPSLLTEHQLSVHQGIKPFKCHICERSFAKKSHLERHLLSHSAEKPFHCSYCDKSFTTSQQLKRHEITHTKSFKCPYPDCSESFYKHPQLRAHILAVHEKKLTCEECGKTFQRPYRLRNHIAKHHNPQVENPYQCTHSGCTKNFKTWSQLQNHIKNDHPKLRCPICDKPCVGDNGLQMHMRVHDETLVAKNWKCHLCDSGPFAKKSDLLDHYRSEHPAESLPHSLKAHALPEAVDSPDMRITRSLSKRRKLNDFDLVQTEVNLANCLSNASGGIELVLDSVGRKLLCPFDKCYRTFKTKERYEKHIQKHKIHELKLKVLQDKLEEKHIESPAMSKARALDDEKLLNKENQCQDEVSENLLTKRCIEE